MSSARTTPRKVLASLFGTAIVGGTCVAAYMLWPTRLPGLDAPTAELVKFVTTDQFAKLPEEKQAPYVELLMNQSLPTLVLAAMQANLTEQERERGIDNAMQAAIGVRFGPHLETWLKLDEKARREYAKKAAKDMPPGAFGGSNAPPGRGMTPERVKRFVENTPPGRRAAMAEFMSDMRRENEGPNR